MHVEGFEPLEKLLEPFDRSVTEYLFALLAAVAYSFDQMADQL